VGINVNSYAPTVAHPYLTVAHPLAFAHRGGASAHPENTALAFEYAVSLGYTHLETDVHVTADGVAVAFHDHSLDRLTDRVGKISELKWAEVGLARVAGKHPICRLDELLASFPETYFNLDPKHDAAVVPLVDVLQRSRATERVCVCSFSGRRTHRVKREIGDLLCTGAGPAEVVGALARGWRLPTLGRGADVLQVPVGYGRINVVTKRFIDAAHRVGQHVHVWTIDVADEIERLLDLGVDGIMTDEVEVLRDVYRTRGYWPE
jgi:glycerophosphoryl diester phosphodiesterase